MRYDDVIYAVLHKLWLSRNINCLCPRTMVLCLTVIDNNTRKTFIWRML